MGILEIENSNGWEPYKPMPDNGPFLAVNDEHYTDLGYDVDPDDNTILVCSGPGTIKTGGLGLLLTFPVGDQFLRIR